MARTDLSYNPANVDEFKRLGHPGRYVEPIRIANDSVELTGSLYGYGAILVQNASGLEVTASNGTVIDAAVFTANTIYDIGLKRVVTGASGIVYVFKRFQ